MLDCWSLVETAKAMNAGSTVFVFIRSTYGMARSVWSGRHTSDSASHSVCSAATPTHLLIVLSRLAH